MTQCGNVAQSDASPNTKDGTSDCGIEGVGEHRRNHPQNKKAIGSKTNQGMKIGPSRMAMGHGQMTPNDLGVGNEEKEQGGTSRRKRMPSMAMLE